MRGIDAACTLVRRYLEITRDLARTIGDEDVETASQLLGEREALHGVIQTELTGIHRGEDIDSEALGEIEDMLGEIRHIECGIRRSLNCRQEDILGEMRAGIRPASNVSQRPPVALDLRA